MRLDRRRVLLAGAVMACSALSRVPVPQRGEDSFDDPATLRRYQSYTDDAGWRIADGMLHARGPALQSVLIRQDVRFANGFVEATSFRADDGGLVLRFQDEGNYYLLAFRDDKGPWPRGRYNLAVYRRRGDEFRELWRTDVRWRRESSHTVRFQARGTRLTVWMDGRMIGALEDRDRPLGAGRVGVRHHGDDATWITRFDRFRWHQSLP